MTNDEGPAFFASVEARLGRAHIARELLSASVGGLMEIRPEHADTAREED